MSIKFDSAPKVASDLKQIDSAWKNAAKTEIFSNNLPDGYSGDVLDPTVCGNYFIFLIL